VAPADRTGRAASAKPAREAAPVIVYHMDKTRRDAARLVEILEGAGIPHKVMNIQDDPAAQMAVRRDSKGFRLPVVFIAGEVVGARSELSNLASSGELIKKVFG
jgi:glutaredoxin-related protein